MYGHIFHTKSIKTAINDKISVQYINHHQPGSPPAMRFPANHPTSTDIDAATPPVLGIPYMAI
jgi:hypothetical protein